MAELQALIDRSYEAAGPHLLRIHDPARRLSAEQVVQRLVGMRLLVLATVTADHRPLAGPVDGIFHRGSFHFGSAPDSVRFRHIRARPHVSATHLPGEELAVTVHGRAIPVDVAAPSTRAFARPCSIYMCPATAPNGSTSSSIPVRSTPGSRPSACSPSGCLRPDRRNER